MEATCWPLRGLRLTTPRLELRLPDLPLLEELAALASAGVHDPAEMPFSVPWTKGSPEEVARSVFQYVLRTIGQWQPTSWTLSLVVVRQGEVVGLQDLMADDFAVTREVSTGSRLGLRHQGQGIGTEMRAAALHLAFAGLDARAVTSAAMTDNPRSLGVSRRLGYEPDGVQVASVDGRRRTLHRLRLGRDGWERHRTVPVEVSGLAECRSLFGC